MDPKSAISKAQELRDKAEKMKSHAEELESDAKERMVKIANLDSEISDAMEEERKAYNEGDKDKQIEKTREVERLKYEKRNEEIGGPSGTFL